MTSELNGKLIAGKYRIDERLAEAGLGELYRGTNTLLEKPVSLSVASNGADASRFFAEAKTVAKVSHPNILNLTDFGTEPNGTAYAVFEAAAGETLREAIDREGQLPVEMAVDIAKQTAAALSAANGSGDAPSGNPGVNERALGGVVHGNLNPSNILAASPSPGTVKVKVFGFGGINAINDDARSQNSARFAYLAPEQCSGSEAADHRGDVYSLGAILFEMLSGSVPFTGETPTEVMMRHIEEPPPPLSSFRTDVPPSLEPVILKALAKNPEVRYENADDFALDLSNAIAGQPLVATAATDSNNIWKTAFVVLAGISLLTAALIYLTSSKQTDPTTAAQPDANGMPVQPINPATGVEEQNLSNLPPDYTMFDANTNTAIPPGTMPGDANNPWLNGTAPPAGAPIPPGGSVIQIPPGGTSPFMADSNCVPQPSGILLCTVPITPTPAPRATATPRTPANANTTTSAATPTPQLARPSPTPASTPAQPARTPSANRPDPNAVD